MKILSIDTATKICGVALIDNSEFIGEFSINIGNLHDQKLVSMISGLLNACNDSLDSIDVISVSIGPGSFTGLRIGLSAAKGLAVSKNKHIIGISTLDAIAYRYYMTHPDSTDNMICAINDAKRDEVYYALYKFDKTKILNRFSDFKCDSIHNLKDHLDPNAIIIGDCVKKVSESFNSSNYRYDFTEMSRADVKSLAILAYERAVQNKFDDPGTLEPIYVKEFIPILKSRGEKV
jgi:tRNA threonylcarbamoyladenosine biosynthesis protein TsaB